MKYWIHRWRQNLKKEDRTRHLWYQRGHWWLRERGTDRDVGSLGWALAIPGHHPGVRFAATPTGDEPFEFHLGLGLFDLWLDVDARWLRRLSKRLTPQHKGYTFHDQREVSLRFFGGAMWWTVWMDGDESSSKDPKWRRGSWHPVDTLLGRTKYSEQELHTEQAVISMPEGEYPCTVTLKIATWTRARWPWPWRVVRRAEVDVPNPPLFAGKGESDWDMDDDGYYSSTMPATTVLEAITSYRESVIQRRKRYGNPHGIEA